MILFIIQIIADGALFNEFILTNLAKSRTIERVKYLMENINIKLI